MPIAEVRLDYGRRVEGSPSKLSTFRDGFRILWTLAMLMKETRPFVFFSFIALILMAVSIGFMAPIFAEYFATGLVTRLPTWVLAVAMVMSSLLIFTAGIILDSLARARTEQKRANYLLIPGLHGTRDLSDAIPLQPHPRQEADSETIDIKTA
jgi:hypothetical protein